MGNLKLQDQYPTDENGLPHGKWISVYSDGKLMYHVNYVHGVYHGLQEGYRPDGMLSYLGYYNMGIRVGYWYYSYQTNECYLWLV